MREGRAVSRLLGWSWKTHQYQYLSDTHINFSFFSLFGSADGVMGKNGKGGRPSMWHWGEETRMTVLFNQVHICVCV